MAKNHTIGVASMHQAPIFKRCFQHLACPARFHYMDEAGQANADSLTRRSSRRLKPGRRRVSALPSRKKKKPARGFIQDKPSAPAHGKAQIT
jgi:hypothetical protein